MPGFSRIFTAPLPRGPALVVGLLAAAACSPPAVTSERNDAVPIPPGATVAFQGSTSNGSTRVDPAVANDSVHHMIQRAIATQLRQKGYTVVDSSQPATFTVRYYLSMTSTTGYAPTAGGVSGPKVGGYRGYGYGYGQEVLVATPDTLKNVSFEVGLVDEKAGRTAWRGIYQREPKNEAPNEKRINTLAAEIFKTLPKVP